MLRLPLRSARHLNTFDGGVSRLHRFKSQRGVDYPFQFAMIAFNHVVPVLNLSVFQRQTGTSLRV